MKRQTKQLISLLLTVVLLLGIVPVRTNAASGDTVRINVTNAAGSPVSDATVVVKYRASSWFGVEYELAVTNAGNGQYTFVSKGYGRYTFEVSRDGYEPYSNTNTYTNPGNVYNITLEGGMIEEFVSFKIFYYLSSTEEKRFPDNYAGAGEQGDYGPSGDNTPLVTIDVDINKLKTMDGVSYVENDDGTYYFVPETQDQDMDAAQKFWDAVWECTSDESKKVFEATGLAKEFLGYCLKRQGDGSCHGDGILHVQPPVYVLEMYHNDVYFAGEAVDSSVAGMDVYDLLKFCEDYLTQTITWTEDALGRPAQVDGKYQGDYIDNGRFYKVTITQRPITAGKEMLHTSGLKYEEINSLYYLAQFDVDVVDAGPVTHTVTYTDGVADEVIYNDHMYPVNSGEMVPAYTGIYIREGYTFIGWVLENSDGSILSDAQVQAMEVHEDMTFHAAWQLVPHYTGRVELVLNGTYDASTHTATGQRIAAESIRGEGVLLFVKEENGNSYIQLQPKQDEVGVYTASLENGNYYFFYSTNQGVTMVSTGNQQLTINNEDRTRYLFYNSVTYDLNGGSGGPQELTTYHRSGYSVTLAAEAPTKTGYVFTGWKDQNGKLHQPGAELTQDIAQAYTLTAQWETVTRAKVNLTVEIDHRGASGEGIDPADGGTLVMNLMYRSKNPVDPNEPYVEIPQHEGVSYQKVITGAAWFADSEDKTQTTIVYEAPFFEDLSTDYEYSANAIMAHYWNVGRTVTTATDAEGNVTYDVVIHLQYNPDLFNLKYTVRLDESVPDNTVDATDIKIISWNAQEENA